VKREILYRWRDAHRLGGPEALRLKGRPSTTDALAMTKARSVAAKADDLAIRGHYTYCRLIDAVGLRLNRNRYSVPG
jgi:hypothetical protein